MANAKIMNCSCSNSGQDKMYGKGRRVFNPCKSANKDVGIWRCTVCTKEVQGKSSDDVASVAR